VGDLRDRPAGGTDQRHRVALELLGELAPSPWLLGLSLLLFHPDILLSPEVSCLRGEAHHGAHSPQGLWVRVAQRLLALAAGIWFNWQLGVTDKRSLVAYDH
jgi:hypothetical protein